MNLMLLIGVGLALALAWCYMAAVVQCDEDGISSAELRTRFRAWCEDSRNRRMIVHAAWFGVLVAMGVGCGLAATWRLIW